jgi:chorismate dehydratase
VSNDLTRCGRIAYTNDLPVYTAIDEDVLTFPGLMVSDVPSRLNQALLEGRLDISPISSAFYAEHTDELVLLSDVCIGAHAKVHSICCVSRLEPKELAGRTVAVTKESATGRALFRLICRRYYGFDPVTVDSDDPFAQYQGDGTPCLLIGDKAIDAAEQAPLRSIHDLGELWHAFTGSGMVYAVWAARKDYARQSPALVRSVAAALRDSLAWGLENISAVIARAQMVKPRAAGFYEQYYHALHFRFDDTARTALGSFFLAAHEMGVIDRLPALQFFDEVPQHV